MNLALKIFILLVILSLGFLLTTRAIPGIFLRLLRLVGFRVKATPITQKRIARFKRIKRGYYSFLAITTLFVTSLFLELMVNRKALVIHFDGKTAFPAVEEWLDKVVFFTTIASFHNKNDFGQTGESEVDYAAFARYCDDPSELRADIEKKKSKLAKDKARFFKEPKPGPEARRNVRERYERKLRRFKKEQGRIDDLESRVKAFEEGRAWCLMPLYPYSPDRVRKGLPPPPNGPSFELNIPLGTDLSGRDTLCLMLYGFRICLAFALLIAAIGYTVGIIVGGIQGYYGSWTDIVTQRIEEIWGSIPFLFTIMIIGSLVERSFGLLVGLMIILRSWLGITYYIRGEFYREKAKDYVQAAIGAGVSNWRIMTRHILPNSLVPVVTFAPFGIVAYIFSLVSLDYLGFGLPPGTPSWGAILRMGLENVKFYPHLTIIPTVAMAVTLFCVVMVGEAVREAFDPKVFSRLR